MQIREANYNDFGQIWPILQDILRAGDTYAYPPDTSKNEAQKIWMETPNKTFIAEENDTILASYYIKTNQQGPGDHVCNCGYIVAKQAQGKGLATALCEHSQETAVKLGFKAMQFNFVASTNEGAVYLWKKLGFETVGCLPKAFNHPKQGYVDAFVMFKWLNKNQTR